MFRICLLCELEVFVVPTVSLCPESFCFQKSRRFFIGNFDKPFCLHLCLCNNSVYHLTLAPFFILPFCAASSSLNLYPSPLNIDPQPSVQPLSTCLSHDVTAPAMTSPLSTANCCFSDNAIAPSVMSLPSCYLPLNTPTTSISHAGSGSPHDLSLTTLTTTPTSNCFSDGISTQPMTSSISFAFDCRLPDQTIPEVCPSTQGDSPNNVPLTHQIHCVPDLSLNQLIPECTSELNQNILDICLAPEIAASPKLTSQQFSFDQETLNMHASLELQIDLPVSFPVNDLMSAMPGHVTENVPDISHEHLRQFAAGRGSRSNMRLTRPRPPVRVQMIPLDRNHTHGK